VAYADKKRSLRACIAVCLQIHCNPSGYNYFTDVLRRVHLIITSRERLHSTVMSTSVCVSVCLSRGYFRNHARDLYQFLCMFPMAFGSVLLRQGDEIPRGSGNFGGFLPHWQCIVQRSIWDPYKNGLTDRDAVWDDEWAWPEEQCFTWGSRSRRGSGSFGENVPDKPNTPVNCELDWSMKRRGHDRDRRLIASIGRVFYRPRRGDCTPLAKSDTHDCLVDNTQLSSWENEFILNRIRSLFVRSECANKNNPVAVMHCRRFDCRRFGLSPFWL